MLKIRPQVRLLLSLALGSALLAGCAIGPDYKKPTAPTPDSSHDHYKAVAGASTAGTAITDQWWTQFGDDLLNDLESQVTVNNQNIAQASAAYMQARALVRQDRSALLPSFGVSAGATRSGGPANPIRTGASHTSTSYSAGGSASWELDVWGRLRRTLENSKASAQASAADLANARLSVQSALAVAYLQLRGADAERRLIADTTTAYARTLTITQNRYTAGTVARTDVLQAQTQLYSAQNEEQQLLLERAQLENSIAALIGRPASGFAIEPRETWDLPTPEIPAGVPSQLLQRRPDIAAAERQMAAANAIIGVQEASYLPALTLTGSYGFASTALSTLFDSSSLSHSFGGSLSQTLLDFGGRRAQVEQARDAYDQQIASYRQTVLTAFQDVENDLAAAGIYAHEFDILTQQSQAADLAEQLTLNQYKAGTADMTTVVIQQTLALSTRLSLAEMRVQRQTNAVGLITDLGGGWQAPDYSHYD